MDIETILLIIAAVAIPTALWLKERYARLMADGKITLDEVIDEVKALGDKAEEVKDAVEDIIEEQESEAESDE
jgi:hypothetical protein